MLARGVDRRVRPGMAWQFTVNNIRYKLERIGSGVRQLVSVRFPIKVGVGISAQTPFPRPFNMNLNR